MHTITSANRTEPPAVYGGTPAFPERFRFIQPTLPPLEKVIARYSEAYANGLITNADIVSRFEAAAARYLDVTHCVALSSCTSGLMLTLRALGLKGEVILPSFTFFATGHAVRWNGLTPVFSDCDPLTWNLDPEDVERRITPRTSAILAVHMYGNPCDIEGLEFIAAKHGLPLLFDAAHGFGSRYRGKPIGGFGTAEVFSLSPTKLLVAGEGGLVATNDSSLAAALRSMRNYGDLGAYDPDWVGMNARMSEYNAALGLEGLSIVESKLQRHNRIASAYTETLAHLAGVRFQKIRSGDVCTYKDYSIHIDAAEFGMTRDELGAALLAENIETKKYFYPPLHQQKLYRPLHDPARGALGITEFVSGGILSLPIYESLSDATVEGVAYAIARIARYQASGQKRSYRHAGESAS